MIENKTKKLQIFQRMPASMINTNNTAVTDLFLNVAALNAIGVLKIQKTRLEIGFVC
jgi:hypothetical protein